MTSIRKQFTPDFIFGVATAAYQIEGHKFGGAGTSIWDQFAKNGNTFNKQDGALACDHYHRYEEDLDLIKAGGFDAYRFSFSWARLLPDGKTVNQEGVDFYHRLLDAVRARGLLPFATAYHWDMPQVLGDLNGWLNRDNTERFADYMQLITKEFGDKIETLSTINEPWCASWLSFFEGRHAPGLKSLPAAAVSMHNILLAHGRGLAAVRAELKASSASKKLPCGIVINFTPGTSASEDRDDVAATQQYNAIHNDWFLSAVTRGEYPKAALEVLEPYMPDNWADDMALISQPIDFLGVNFYSSVLLQASDKVFPAFKVVSRGLPQTDMDWEIDPDALANLFDFIGGYTSGINGGLPLYVTENGMASQNHLKDSDRIDYFEKHLAAVASKLAKHPIRGYFAWSLLDNFEWSYGYEKRFGIVHVDYDTQKRTAKESYNWWQKGLTKEG